MKAHSLLLVLLNTTCTRLLDKALSTHFTKKRQLHYKVQVFCCVKSEKTTNSADIAQLWVCRSKNTKHAGKGTISNKITYLNQHVHLMEVSLKDNSGKIKSSEIC